MHDKQAIDCILWGGYACGNFGDELTLAVALRDMRERWNGSIAILSGQPGYTMRLFPGVKVVAYKPVLSRNPYWRIRRLFGKVASCLFNRPIWKYRARDQFLAHRGSEGWAAQVSACKMLYLVGGGYFTDLFDIERFLLPVMVAKATGVSIATAPLGIGPFTSKQAAKKTLKALAGSSLLVRDKASLAFCMRNGLSARQAKDDGFRAMEVMSVQPQAKAQSLEKPRVGINIFEQHGSVCPAETKLWWTDLLKALAQEPVTVEAFCFHTDLFSDFSRAMECCLDAGLHPSVVHPPPLDFRVACSQLADFDVIVSSRFHAAVVGNLLAKATFAVYDSHYYKHKMHAAADGFERSQTLTPVDVTASEAAQRILEAATPPKGHDAPRLCHPLHP